MRDPEPRVIRLSDYHSPDWLIERVDLDVHLDSTNTKIITKLKVRQNPEGRLNQPFVLDGDELTLEDLQIDGKSLGSNEYAATPSSLTLNNPPSKAFTLTI